MAKGKREKIKLESQIQKILWSDNEVTSHFDYRVHMNSKNNTIELNLLTYNSVHEEYMLLHRILGKSSIDCLEKMIDYLKNVTPRQTYYSYTITWNKIGEKGEPHVSYFRGKTENDVKNKFLHERKESDYDFTIKMNPLT
jgi:hypothetical protein